MRILPIALLVLSACAATPQIVYPGTSAYDERVRGFAVSPTEAREIAGRPYGSFGPSAVVGREYVFSEPQKLAVVRLDGIYVNGDTGEREHRKSDTYLTGNLLTSLIGFPHGMPKQLPPGTFDGIDPKTGGL
jgi:hypothetical protein